MLRGSKPVPFSDHITRMALLCCDCHQGPFSARVQKAALSTWKSPYCVDSQKRAKTRQAGCQATDWRQPKGKARSRTAACWTPGGLSWPLAAHHAPTRIRQTCTCSRSEMRRMPCLCNRVARNGRMWLPSTPPVPSWPPTGDICTARARSQAVARAVHVDRCRQTLSTGTNTTQVTTNIHAAPEEGKNQTAAATKPSTQAAPATLWPILTGKGCSMQAS